MFLFSRSSSRSLDLVFDSSCVTKSQVRNIEHLIEPHADRIRGRQADFVKLDRPVRFAIQQTNSDSVLMTIPSEYNDCFLTLVNRSDPLRKSELVTELVRDKFLDEIKDNSLDIRWETRTNPRSIEDDSSLQLFSRGSELRCSTRRDQRRRSNDLGHLQIDQAAFGSSTRLALQRSTREKGQCLDRHSSTGLSFDRSSSTSLRSSLRTIGDPTDDRHCRCSTTDSLLGIRSIDVSLQFVRHGQSIHHWLWWKSIQRISTQSTIEIPRQETIDHAGITFLRWIYSTRI